MTKSKKLLTLLLTLALSIVTVFTGVISVSADTATKETKTTYVDKLVEGLVSLETQNEVGGFLEDYATTSNGVTTVKIPCLFLEEQNDEIFLSFNNVFNGERKDTSFSVLNFYFRAYNFTLITDSGEKIEIGEIAVLGDENENYYELKNDNTEFLFSINAASVEYDSAYPQDYLLSFTAKGAASGIDYVGEGYFTFNIESCAVIEEKDDGSTLGDWLKGAGNDVSNWLSNNIGVSIGGTASLILIVAIIVILLRKKRR